MTVVQSHSPDILRGDVMEKFIPYKKLSKKNKKKIDKQGRTTWKINPITRYERKGYKRKRDKIDYEDD